MADPSSTVSDPDLRTLVRWLLGTTPAVHPPLLFSTMCRIVALSLDVALFATAAATVVHLASGGDGGVLLFVVLVALALAKAGFFYLEQFSGHYVAFKALELLRTYVFSKLWPKAPAIVAESRSGDLLAGLTRDVDRIEVVYAHTFAPVVSAYVVGPAALVVAGALLGWQPVALGGICLGLSLFVVPLLGLKRAWSDTATNLAQRRTLSHHISDSVFGIDEVLGYGREAQRLDEMDELGRDISRSAARPRDLVGVRRGLNVVSSLVATISVVWIGAGSEVGLSPVALAALAAGTLRVFEGPRGVEDAVGYLDHSLAAVRRLWQVAHTPERVTDGPEHLVLDHAPSVRFEGVCYAYPGREGTDPVDVLRDVTFEVPAGGHAVLAGHSGSGKSTLIQLLLRYDDPRAGSITLDCAPIDRYTLDSLRRTVVAVSQENRLLDRSLAENLRLGAPDAGDEELWEALAVVRLADEVAAMPDGLQTAVGWNGSSLSGGQVQRVCLARALLMDPKVLVLDEFTANLNTGLEDEIRVALAEWGRELTVVEVTHRPDAVPNAVVVAVLDDGLLFVE